MSTSADPDVRAETGPRPYRRIACEEGFLSPAVLAANARTSVAGIPLITADGPAGGLARLLVDVGPGRSCR